MKYRYISRSRKKRQATRWELLAYTVALVGMMAGYAYGQEPSGMTLDLFSSSSTRLGAGIDYAGPTSRRTPSLQLHSYGGVAGYAQMYEGRGRLHGDGGYAHFGECTRRCGSPQPVLDVTTSGYSRDFQLNHMSEGSNFYRFNDHQ